MRRGPLAWVLTSEIQPLETRSLAQGITVRTTIIFEMVVFVVHEGSQGYVSRLFTSIQAIFYLRARHSKNKLIMLLSVNTPSHCQYF